MKETEIQGNGWGSSMWGMSGPIPTGRMEDAGHVEAKGDVVPSGMVVSSGEGRRMENSTWLLGQRSQSDSPGQQGQWQKQADGNEVGDIYP